MAFRTPSLGTVLGATALTVALISSGGVAEAAKMINGKLIKPNTVTTKQIKDGTISPADLSAAARVAGPTGPAGPVGPPGAKGDTGTPGSPGVSGVVHVEGTYTVSGTNILAGANAYCPVGTKALGGGGRWFNATGASIAAVHPVLATRDGAGNVTGYSLASGGTLADGWIAQGTSGSTANNTIQAFVICGHLA